MVKKIIKVRTIDPDKSDWDDEIEVEELPFEPDPRHTIQRVVRTVSRVKHITKEEQQETRITDLEAKMKIIEDKIK